MENANGDVPAQPAPNAQGAAQDLQQQINYLRQQLHGQQQLFMQQAQFLNFQQQNLQQILGNQQQRIRAEPHKVKLPPMWTVQIRTWFQLVESQFGTYAVVDPRQRFDLVVAALSDEARMHSRAVVENPFAFQDPYLALRARLLEVYQPSVWQQAAEFLRGGELGARKPSDLMDEMLSLLPEDLSLLVKAAFLGRLPAEMREHIQQGAEALSYQQLAARADSIWNARNANKPAVVAAVDELPPGDQQAVDPDSLENVLAAVRFSKQPAKTTRRTFGKQDGADPGKKGWCWKHKKFGKDAWDCKAPNSCQFPKN